MKGSRAGRYAKVLAAAAGLCLSAIGVWLGYQGFVESQKAEKRRLAIDALSRAHSKEFLDAYVRLTRRADPGPVVYEGVEFDIAYVMNGFEHIAMLYLYDLADRCVLKTSVALKGPEVLGVLGSLTTPYPRELRRHFDLLMGRLASEDCREPWMQ